jgi:ubiquinol-cytochrome c reductase cytochrome c subunit
MTRRRVLAVVLCAAAGCGWPSPSPAPAQSPQRHAGAGRTSGAALYDDGCVSCHGPDARGVPGRAPSLRGVGAAALDFYLATGRMPLSDPTIEPPRTEPPLYGAAQRHALIAYLTQLQPGGEPIPVVHPQRGDLARGRRLFADTCSGCHQIVGKGGVDPEIVAPSLDEVTPVQIGEAIRVGPYLMPRFDEHRLDAHDVDSIARYVTEIVQHPPDRGGWGIGNTGPIPEGLVVWLLAGGVLIVVARIIGKRATG